MTDADTDVYRIVAYGQERYWMNRVPLALLGCAAGLFMLAMDPIPPGLLPVLILLALFALGSLFGISSKAWDHAMDSHQPRWKQSIGFALALVLGAILWFAAPPRYQRSTVVDLSFGTLGWMFVLFSLGYIGYALLRHFRPGPPMLMLSPAGLHFNIPWLKNLMVPWYEVEHAGLLEHVYDSGVTVPFPNSPVIVVSQDYYQREIEPKISFLSGNLWSAMFQEKRNQMQILLPWSWFAVEQKDLQEPVDARWKAFREQPDAKVPATTAPPLRISAWSRKAQTRWRQVGFAIPAACVALMLVHFVGAWDTAFFKTARQDFGKQRAHAEAVRDAARKGQYTIDGGQNRR